MAEGRAQRYEYKANTNYVLNVSKGRRARAEHSGEAGSMRDRIRSLKMGDRIGRDVPKELQTRARSQQSKQQAASAAGAALGKAAGGGGILAAMEGVSSAADTARYTPTTIKAQKAWESMLVTVRQVVGDVPSDALRDAAEELAAIARSSAIESEEERLEQATSLLGSPVESKWAQLQTLAGSLDDFEAMTGGGEDQGFASSQAGVAVVLDDEDEGAGESRGLAVGPGAMVTVIGDDEDDDAAGGDEDADSTGQGEGEVLVAGSSSASAAAGVGGVATAALAVVEQRGLVPLAAIDGFWVQRQVGRIASDEQTAQAQAQTTLSTMRDARDARDLEALLLDMLGYDQFDLVRTLIKNRARVVWMTALRGAATEEAKAEVFRAMAADTHPVADAGTSEIPAEIGRDCGAAVLTELEAGADPSGWSGTVGGGLVARTRAEIAKLQGATASAASAAGAAAASSSSSSSAATGATSAFPAVSGDAAALSFHTSRTGRSGGAEVEELDLSLMAFKDGAQTMTNANVVLEGSVTTTHKGYEEIHVPALKPRPLAPGERLVPIADLPVWCRPAFAGMSSLNRVQSRLYGAALSSAGNLLLCAPTGAGKTNVAVLTILQQLGQHRQPDGSIDTSKFKIVYVAPMKALVQEVVSNLSNRLTEAYGVQVRELSGDNNLTASQLNETQVIVTTPEKWDIVTRKAGDGRSYTRLVRLIIIDEVHLLHDSRGPVLEAIVARTLRHVETSREQVRIVGLSATLPNYEDVAACLRVDPDEGLFFFDGSYRPCPLQQTFVGVTDRKPLKRMQVMNEVAYSKLEAQAGEQQGIVFVHSRKDTARTARALRDMALKHDALGRFIKEGSAAREILAEQAEGASNADLKELLPYGFAIHHAGMLRSDRSLVEALFEDGHVQVLVSTATLAWGVNLPAHTVIIKGTQIYDPEKGAWGELSPQDVLQMLGRAGRPQFDTFGEGVLITGHEHMRYYTSLLSEQLPIESQMIKALPDHLNAEIASGSIADLRDAARWLTYTYLFVRMLRSPATYSVPGGAAYALERDPRLLQHRLNLAHTAAALLDRQGLVRYDRATGALKTTDLGRVAAYFYVTHPSIAVYNQHMRPNMTEIGIFRLFSLSHEFRNIVVRDEEKEELVRMREEVPVPVRESAEEPSCKVNILLQAYISRLKLDGLALVADMTYIQQSASRIFRALFEVALRRGWASLSRRLLQLCQMVDHRVWMPHTPLRQFITAGGIELPDEICHRLERRDLDWERYVDLKPADLGELVRAPRLGRALHKLVHCFPRLALQAHVQPISRSALRIDLTAEPDFEWDVRFHGPAQTFWVLVEDADGEVILHHEQLRISRWHATEPHSTSFVIPLPDAGNEHADPMPPPVFIRVLADRWLHAESTLPVSMSRLIRPQRFLPPTQLLDLRPQRLDALEVPAFAALYDARAVGPERAVTALNPIQTQCFSALYKSNDNCLVAAAPGSGKTLCGELAMLRLWRSEPDGKVVYISPHAAAAKETFADWSLRFGDGLGKTVVELTGEIAADRSLTRAAHIVVATAEQWDRVSRRWRKREEVRQTRLVIMDDVHLIGARGGPKLEVVCGRMRVMGRQLEELIRAQAEEEAKAAGRPKPRAADLPPPLRIVALAAPVANSRDFAEWLGVPPASRFAFHPRSRPQRLDIGIEAFDVPNATARLAAMARPCYTHLAERCGVDKASREAQLSASATSSSSSASSSSSSAKEAMVTTGKPGLVFTPSRRQVQMTAIDLLAFAAADGDAGLFNRVSASAAAAAAARASDAALQHCLSLGVGFVHEALSDADRNLVEELQAAGRLGVVVVASEACWETPMRAHAVIIMGTQGFDGKEQQHVDIPVASLLRMTGRACRPRDDDSGFVAVMCSSARREFLRRFLFERLPVESHLDQALHEPLNAEIVAQTVTSKSDAVDWLTWTYLFRRLPRNPNYYNLAAASSDHLSDFFSELVETVLADLEAAGCVELEEGDGMGILPLSLGQIAAFYDVQHTTMEIMASSLSAKTRLRGALEVVAAAAELDELPVRAGEKRVLQQLATHLPHAMPEETEWTDPHTKAHILLQCHLERSPLPTDLKRDLEWVLARCLPLLGAMVDVIASDGWFSAALAAMELSQSLVQGVWASAEGACLLQLPHFDAQRAAACAAITYKPEDEDEDAATEPVPLDSVFALIEADDEARTRALTGLSSVQATDVAAFCNRYPSVEMSWVLAGATGGGDGAEEGEEAAVEPESGLLMRVTLEREEGADGLDEGAGLGAVLAPRFPLAKTEGWWLVIGDPKSKRLYGLKRVTFGAKGTVKVPFAAPSAAGVHELQVLLMSDAYLGCDVERQLHLRVTAAEAEDAAGDAAPASLSASSSSSASAASASAV